MNNQEFDDIIKNKAQQRDAEVPEDIWENIMGRKKKRRIPFFWWMFLSLLVTGIAVVWILNTTSTKPETTEAAKDDIENKKTNQTSDDINKVENTGAAEKENSLTVIPEKKKNDTTLAVLVDTKKDISVNNSEPEISNNSANSFAENRVKNTIGSKKIVIPEATNLPQQLNNENKIADDVTTSSKQRPGKDKGKFKVKSFGGETDSVRTDMVEEEFVAGSVVTKEDLPHDKTDLPRQKNNTDSLQIKTAITHLLDSSKEKEKSSTATATKKKPVQPKYGKLSVELAVARVLPMQKYEQPLHTKRILARPFDVRSEFISDNIKTTIESGTAFSASFIKRLDKKWSLGAGIQYLQFTELLSLSGVETNSDNATVQKTSTIIDGRNAYYNFTIPVFVHYSFLQQRRWAAALRAGVYFDVLRKYHNDIPGEFENVYAAGVRNSTSKNTAGADIFAGLHITGAFSKKYEWFVEPAFRYNLSRYNLNALSFNKKIQKTSVSVGVAYRF